MLDRSLQSPPALLIVEGLRCFSRKDAVALRPVDDGELADNDETISCGFMISEISCRQRTWNPERLKHAAKSQLSTG